ncbi:MAG: QueT transporter family protein [Eubacteriaceae bacterium]|nr:QueT transporter family protein [Eubacteriaceae bacterium]
MEKKNNPAAYLAKTALIAALYCAVSFISQPIAFGVLQLRIAEGLCLLTLYTPCAVPGLTVGCFITNIFSPYGLADMIAGTLATLLAALTSRRIKNKFLSGVPYVLFNAFIISGVIAYQAGSKELFFVQALIIGLEEALSVYGIGMPMIFAIEKNEGLKSIVSDD